MVVDELRGIPLVDFDDSDADEDFAGSGSTHIGEANGEDQHLIKELVHRLKHLREEQQKEFDFHHQRRQAKWQQYKDGGDETSCDYNVNKFTTYSGISLLENHRIPQSLYSAASKCREIDPRCPSEALHLLNVFEDETTTTDKLATYVTVNLAMDPFSSDGGRWLRLARETILRLQEDPRILGGVEISIGGSAAEYHDKMQDIAASVPFRLAVFSGVVVLILAFTLGNFMLTLEVLVTFATTIATALGAGVLVYVDGALAWTKIPALSQTEVTFELPTVCLLMFSVLLIQAIASQRQQSVEASSKVATLCVAVVSCLTRSSPFLVVFAIALTVQMLWVQRLVLPALSSVLPNGRKVAFENKNMRRTSYRCDKDKQNQAYQEKFESFLMSPQAP
jgi:MMPL family